MKIYIPLTLMFLQGCAPKHQLKSYVSVEKPPMKVVYIDYAHDINSQDIDRYIRAVSKVPYKNYKMNESNIVDFNYNVNAASDHVSTSTLNF